MENIVERLRPQMTIWSMRIACWITKPTNTHSEYVILIAYPRQQRLHESALMLRYTYIVCVDCIMCCVGSDFCDKLITRPGSRLCASWAVASQEYITKAHPQWKTHY